MIFVPETLPEEKKKELRVLFHRFSCHLRHLLDGFCGEISNIRHRKAKVIVFLQFF